MDDIKLQVKEYLMRTVPFKIDDFSVFFDIYTTPIAMRLEDMKMHAEPAFTVKIALIAKHPAYDNIGVNIIQLYDDRLRGDGYSDWFVRSICGEGSHNHQNF